MSEAPASDNPLRQRVAERVTTLLADAQAAGEMGDQQLRRSLLTAVLALDPGNEAAAALLTEPAARRQMTLLFCDAVGSTELADRRDPEEVTSLLSVYRRTCEGIIRKYDGFIDDHRGDGMLVLFGYPQVNEDDARRAVNCGLEIVSRVKALPTTGLTPGRPLQVRVVVHTDLVFVGDVGISGSTANEASRMLQLAAPDTVTVSDTTMQLVDPWFEMASLGTHRLRGVSRPVELFCVQREREHDDGRLRSRAPSRFVGRDRELADIVATGRARTESAGGQQSKTEPAAAVLVLGQPGIGKTRLVREAAARIGAPLAVTTCSRLHQHVTLHPFRRTLAAAFGIDPSDPPAARLDKIRERVRSTAGPTYDLPFLAAVFDIPFEMLGPAPDIDASALRQQGIMLVADVLGSGQSPQVLFVDNVHWADQATLELLALLLRTPPARTFLAFAARESFKPSWPASALRVISLGPLAASEMQELAEAIPVRRQLPAQLREQFVTRSDGVPLFLEELVHTEEALGGESPYRALKYSSYAIPPGLRDPLLARLAVPGVDIGLAQMASVIGRDVDLDLLRSAVGAEPADFERRLGTLVKTGIVDLNEAHIRFRHELLREVAYDTQSRPLAQKRHSWLVDHLRGGSFEPSRRLQEELAYHAERALRYEEAIDTHLAIAQADLAVGSHVEASQRLTHVLSLLDHVTQQPRRDAYEFTARGLRSFSVVMTRGYAAPEAAEDHSRCVELCDGSGSRSDSVPYLIRSWSYFSLRGDLDAAQQVAEMTTRLVARTGDRFPARTMGEGVMLFFRGDFTRARRLLEQFVADEWGASPGRVPDGWPLPNDPLSAAYAHLVPLLCIAGEPREAALAHSRGLARAASLAFPYGPFSTLYVDCMEAMRQNLSEEYHAAADVGQSLISRAQRYGFEIWRLAGVLNYLVNAVLAGALHSCDDLVAAVDVWRRDLGADAWTPYWLTMTGFAQRRLDAMDGARKSFEAALAVADTTGSHYFSAEALRGRGQVRLEAHDPGGLDDLVAAARLARAQQARLFEKRAAADLAAVGRR